MKKFKSLFLFVVVALFSLIFLISCEDKKYTVEFDVTGGTEIKNVSVKANEEYTLPKPEKDGYQFDGWYNSSSFDGNPIDKIVIEANIKVYAKWTKLYKVNFELNGGTCSAEWIQLVKGSNVSDALTSYKVTKGLLDFAGWYLNESVLSKDYLMPEEDITLTAKYNQTYSAIYFVEGADGKYTEYETKTESGIVGQTVTSSYSIDGYTKVNKEDSVSSITIGEDASKNVIKEYFARSTFNVTFNSNYPEGESVSSNVEYKTGDTVTFPTGFTYDGYQIIGWALTPDGECVYKVNEIDDLVYNDHDAFEVENQPVTVKEATTYYAVWTKGYTDMFKGEDVIYLLDKNSSLAYLERAGNYFAGEYDSFTNKILFLDVNEDIIVECKLNNDNTFVYSSLVRASLSYPWYSTTTGLNNNITIYLDEYNGVKYSDKNAVDVSKGTYSINDNGTLHIQYSEGNLADTEMDIKIVTFTNGGNGFIVCNNSDIELGKIYLYQVNNGVLDLNANVYLELDGYYAANLSGTSCQYTNKDGIITIMNSSSSYTFKIVEKDGVKGFAQYNKALDHVYTNGEETLTIDGLYQATYQANGISATGFYSLKTSIFSNSTICEFVDDYGVKYQFELTINQEVVDENTITNYSFKKLSEEYKEYLYQNDKGIYYAPLLVIENETEATLYAFVSKGVFQKISEGEYKELENGLYQYTAKTFIEIPEDVKVSTTPYDLSTIKSFTFGTDTASGYFVTYWFNYTDNDNNSSDLTTTYVNSKDSTLSVKFVINKFVVSKDSKEELMGTYKTSKETINDVETVVYTLTTTDGKVYYITLNSENKTFTEVGAIVVNYEYIDGNADKTSYLYKDRMGVVTYNYTTQDEDTKVKKSVIGTVTETGDATVASYPIYLFAATDGSMTFKFILLQLSNGTAYFAKYDESADLTLTSEDNLTSLTCDGYNFCAVWTTEGTSTRYSYQINSDNTISIASSTESFILDVNYDTKTFKKRGNEAKTYFLMDNSSFLDKYVSLDGYGKATVYYYNGTEKVIVDDSSKYTIDYETSLVTMTYTDNSDLISLTCKISSYSNSGIKYNTLIISHESLAKKYIVKANYSVIILDEFGNATIYNEIGVAHTGTYVMISNELFYYVQADGSQAAIYTYDNETANAKKVENEVHGYYSADFDSLLFTDYGYAIFNNKNSYYYNVVDETVMIYQLDRTNKNANEYGFVEEEFGKFDDKVTYKDKTYYINTDYAIKFNRVAENSENYKITLTSGDPQPINSLYFIPRAGEFSVSGQVKVGEKNYSCTVVSELAENGDIVRYVKLGNYIFDIDITYGGVDSETGDSASTFDIVGMRFELLLPHYTFLQMVQTYYSMFGVDYSNKENPYGGLTVLESYNADGSVKESYMSSSFTEKAGFVDSKGQLLNFNKAKFSLQSSSSTITISGTVVGSDNYTYSLVFETASISSPKSMLGVKIKLITRTQEFKDESGYVVSAVQIVNYLGVTSVNDKTYGSMIGSILELTFNNAEGTLENVSYFKDIDDNYYAIVRTLDENKLITQTKYYLLEAAQSDEVSDVAKPFISCKITELSATTYYNADKSGYVDIVNGEIKVIWLNDQFVSYSELSYDETTQIYSYDVVTDSETKSYTLKIVDGVMVITEVVKETSDK